MASIPTQEFVPIKEIRDGVIVLKDGSLRIVMMASSQNLALKSQDEQRAIISQFQNFLNSLDFSAQFFVQSREMDIRPYIALLEERRKEQESELMQVQVSEYIDFVKEFTESINIMKKSFFIVVPYTPPVIEASGVTGFLSSIIPGMGGKKKSREERLSAFEEQRTQLEQRAAVIEQGLASTGVRVVQLGTEELVELFYQIFNPEELEKPVAPPEEGEAARNITQTLRQ